MADSDATDQAYHTVLDTSGLNCPLPILKAKKALAQMPEGAHLHVIATDPGSMPDFKTFSEQTGQPLLEAETRAGKFHFTLEKRLRA